MAGRLAVRDTMMAGHERGGGELSGRRQSNGLSFLIDGVLWRTKK